MKKGWLVINSFVKHDKFYELYRMLLASAEKKGAVLELKTTTDLLFEVDNAFDSLEKPDFVLFWDKDIYLAGRLEHKGFKVYNSARAIEVCDNKILTAMALEQAGVRTPKTVVAPKTYEGTGYNNRLFLEKAEQILGYPMVVKEAYGSFGAQVYLVQNRQELYALVDRLHHKPFLMQEFIASSYGRDVRVNVVGGRVIASMLRYNENDFRSNITNGGSMGQIEITPAQARLAIDACNAIGLDFAGVDVLFGPDDEPIICEVNSNPHFKTTYECTGVDLSEHILEHVQSHA
ncbi:MAG: RimK family alpha-L-glutamate ligase [Lachnospiraceae bacterium]|nr:RimK family alpha-L-glutamate ligase [Lachnospiraceae bacterium]